ncbi:MAG: ABC transporter permease [Acidobacteriota bacterium]|nr:ABC transporter permease [Acidobacteriota bacterium]
MLCSILSTKRGFHSHAPAGRRSYPGPEIRLSDLSPLSRLHSNRSARDLSRHRATTAILSVTDRILFRALPYRANDCDITSPNPARQRCAEVDWNFLPVLGIRPILGDAFSQADVQPGAPRKVILSYGLWRSRFAADKQVVGKTLLLDGAPARITGVPSRLF